MTNKNYAKTKISLPSNYTADERRAIADDLIDHIRERSKEGKGPGDRPWSGAAGKYSKSYKQSFEFKGKKDKSKVTLELFGDMLSSIELISNRPGEIEIGIKKSDEDYSKAEGNIRGTYGSKAPIKGKARPFMDIADDELRKLLRPYRQKKDREELAAAFKAAAAIAKEAGEN